MTAFEYVSVLVAIIVGLGMTHLLVALGQLIHGRDHRSIYWVQLGWAYVLFVALIVIWWIGFRWRHIEEWNPLLYTFLLANPAILYLLTVLLFPRDSEPNLDMRSWFLSRRKPFFALLSLVLVIDVIDSSLKGLDHLRALGAPYLAFAGLGILGCATAARIANQGYHAFFVSVAMVATSLWFYLGLGDL